MSIGSFFSEVLGNAYRNMVNQVPEWGEKLIYRAKFEMWKFEKKIIKNITAVLILLMGFAALALSFVFFLIEYLHFTKTISLLVIGIILLIVGIILKI